MQWCKVEFSQLHKVKWGPRRGGGGMMWLRVREGLGGKVGQRRPPPSLANRSLGPWTDLGVYPKQLVCVLELLHEQMKLCRWSLVCEALELGDHHVECTSGVLALYGVVDRGRAVAAAAAAAFDRSVRVGEGERWSKGLVRFSMASRTCGEATTVDDDDDGDGAPGRGCYGRALCRC